MNKSIVNILRFGLLVLSVVSMRASAPYTNDWGYSAHGCTSGLEWLYDFDTGLIHWRSTITNVSGWAAANEMYFTTGSGGSAGAQKMSNNTPGITTNSFAAAPGQWLKIFAYIATSPGSMQEPTNFNPTYWRVPPNDEFRMTGTNTAGVPMKIKVYSTQTDAELWDSGVIQPGGSYDSGTQMLPAGTTQFYYKTFSDVGFSDGVWAETGSYGQVGPTSSSYAGGDTSSGGATYPAYVPPLPGSNAPTSSTKNNIAAWAPTVSTGSVSGDTRDLLDKATYKQGIDKVASILSTMGTPNVSAQNEVASKTLAAGTGGPSVSSMLDAAAAQRDIASGVFTAGTMPAVSASKTTPDFTVTFPTVFGGGITVNLDPWQNSTIDTLSGWFRNAMLFLYLALYARFVTQLVREQAQAMGAVQQAKGNAIFSGTGAQISAFAAAGFMTVFVLSALATLAGYLTQNFGFGTVVSLWTADPYSTLPGKVAFMLDKMYPLNAVVLYLIAKPITNIAATKVFVGLSAAIRFIVP